MLEKEVKLSSEEIYKGQIIDLFVDKVRCPNNNEATREVIRHCKAACILAINNDGKIIVEKQYRYPYDNFLLELPAGKCDKNEDPKDTALRELEEETGYKAKKIEYLGKLYPTCAYSDEVIYCYLATNLVKTKQHLDENEFLNVNFYELDKILSLIKQDKINDAKTIVAINYYLLSKGLKMFKHS